MFKANRRQNVQGDQNAPVPPPPVSRSTPVTPQENRQPPPPRGSQHGQYFLAANQHINPPRLTPSFNLGAIDLLERGVLSLNFRPFFRDHGGVHTFDDSGQKIYFPEERVPRTANVIDQRGLVDSSLLLQAAAERSGYLTSQPTSQPTMAPPAFNAGRAAPATTPAFTPAPVSLPRSGAVHAPQFGVPMGDRNRFHDENGEFVVDDDGSRMYGVGGGIEPSPEPPDSWEYGLPANQRQLHLDIDERQYHVMDDQTKVYLQDDNFFDGDYIPAGAGVSHVSAAAPGGVRVEDHPDNPQVPTYNLASGPPRSIHIGGRVMTDRGSALSYALAHSEPASEIRALLPMLSDEELHEPDIQSGHTPLMAAVCTGNLEAIDALCSRNMRFDAVDQRGHSALLCAAIYGQPEAAQRLLHHMNAKGGLHLVTQEFARVDREGYDGLALAVLHGTDALTPLFLEALEFNEQAYPLLKRAIQLAVDQQEHFVPGSRQAIATENNLRLLLDYQNRAYSV